MFAALRSRAQSSVAVARRFPLEQTPGFIPLRAFCSPSSSSEKVGLLNIEEVQKILSDVKADDVRVFPMKDQCTWTDFMVIATGRSTWHVKNIAQALIYKVKQKQVGSKRMMLPSVEGHEEGNWIVVDSGTVIVHALDEKARAYYNLEGLWTSETRKNNDFNQAVEKAVVKTRRINNSKKPMKSDQQS